MCVIVIYIFFILMLITPLLYRGVNTRKPELGRDECAVCVCVCLLGVIIGTVI